MHAARHNVVARALGCAFDQNRRLDLNKAPLAEEIAHKEHNLVPQTQVTLHTLAAQIEIAVFETKNFVDLVITVDVKWRGLGRI